MSFGFGLGFPRSVSSAGGPTLNFQFAGSTTLDPLITFTRASNATQFDSAGSLVYAPANLLAWSEDFSNAAWTRSNVTVTSNATEAPDGTITADLFTSTGADGYVGQATSSISGGQTLITSVYLKADAPTTVRLYILETVGGSATQFVTCNVSTAWQRFSVSITLASGVTSVAMQVGGGSSFGTGKTVYAWGAQLNVGSLQSYYPTTTAAYYAPRFDYNPSTLAARGLLIEEARTNSIRNNTMQGAVAGTPGTNPTNWANSTGGLTKTIVGIGTANGIAYVDFRFNGTTSSTFLAITTDVTNVIAASNGQAWTSSAWLSVVGGSTVNLNEIQLQLGQYSSVPTFLSNLNGSNIVSSLTSTSTRFSSTLTTNNASVAFLQPVIVFGFASGVAIDITLRIGLPQLELGAFATSVIPTTTTALTRSADVASVNTLSPWYSATEGTLYADVAVDYTMPASLFPALASLNDNTSANRIELGFVTSAVASFEISVGGSIVTSRYPSVAALNRRVSGAYKANDSAVAVNGAAAQATTPTSASLPTVTKLDIGARAGGSRFTGWVRRITYYPRRLSNAELQAITT